MCEFAKCDWPMKLLYFGDEQITFYQVGTTKSNLSKLATTISGRQLIFFWLCITYSPLCCSTPLIITRFDWTIHCYKLTHMSVWLMIRHVIFQTMSPFFDISPPFFLLFFLTCPLLFNVILVYFTKKWHHALDMAKIRTVENSGI